MAGTNSRGEDKVLVIANNSGFTGSEAISGIQDITPNSTTTEHDLTDAQSGANTENRPGRFSHTFDVTALLEVGGGTDDAGQALLITQYKARAGGYFRYRANGTGTGEPQQQFFAHIYDLVTANANDDEQRLTFRLKVSGAIDYTAQS